MSYRIEGDGSYKHTRAWKDGKEVQYESLTFIVNHVDGCMAWIDTVPDKIDEMIITGIYTIISKGQFHNTRVLFMDCVLRGVQRISGDISKGMHSTLTIDTILLPNIVENIDNV